MIDNQIFNPMMNAGQADIRQQFQPSELPYHNNVPNQQSYTSQHFHVADSQVLPSSRPWEPSAAGTSTARSALSRPRPRPVTMHSSDLSGFNHYFRGQMALAPWGTPANMVPTRNGVSSQTFAVNQAFYEQLGAPDKRQSSMRLEQTYQKLNGTWTPNAYGSAMEMNGMGLVSNAGVPFATEAESFEAFGTNAMSSGSELDSHYNTKRISESSFTMSTTGAQSDMACCEDFSASASEAQSLISDYHPQSNVKLLLSSIHSPVTSPRTNHQNGPGIHRTYSRGKASPTSKQSVRSTPYSADGRNKRWSTGSYASTSRRASPSMLHPTPEGFIHPQQPSSPFESLGPYSHYQPLNMANLQSQQYPYTPNPTHPTVNRTNMVLPSNDFNERILDNQAPRQVPHSLFRMLQSNAEPTDTKAHYESHADRPDLLAALHEEQCDPPPEDMNPSDPNLIPHEQELRFDTDLYTPRWIRGHGKEREGWCGICKPGKWLILKTSAFWYDKSFMHGISAPTGKPFAEPKEMRRSECNPELWEGSCGGCGEWVAMTSHKKKGTTWFRHAYKCHTHAKVKDPTKKRRKSLEKALPASRVMKPQSNGSHISPLRSFGSLNRKMMESAPEDYNMI